MLWEGIRKKLFTLNVFQAFIIISVVTLPLILLFYKHPLDYHSSKTMAYLSLLYFFIAFILYVFLYTISHSANHAVRKKLVIFTRVYIRFHIAVGIMGTILIIIHAIYMFTFIPNINLYAITGTLALVALLAVLITGYLRKQKSSGKRRRYHRYMAFVFIVFTLIHIFVGYIETFT
jgi:hypothetical protein